MSQRSQDAFSTTFATPHGSIVAVVLDVSQDDSRVCAAMEWTACQGRAVVIGETVLKVST